MGDDVGLQRQRVLVHLHAPISKTQNLMAHDMGIECRIAIVPVNDAKRFVKQGMDLWTTVVVLDRQRLAHQHRKLVVLGCFVTSFGVADVLG